MEEIFTGIFRVLGRFLFEIVLSVAAEILFQLPGHWLCKPFTKPGREPDGFLVVALSILFWILVIAASYAGFRLLAGGADA
ncbi:hypothetical protein [Microbulbifer sediminum]|uniref:hypothetical protein n=1 Tax=Microbulbifer sediminum TaxID=2904250 RepID=UPI001F285CE6|nr:hypothetical protein [Microbulbifer sediminum]